MGDRELERDIRDELDLEPGVDATAVAIEVEDGVVTLTGRVPSLAVHDSLIGIVESLRDVRAIDDRVAVRPQPPEAVGDAELARRVRLLLGWIAGLPPEAVRVAVVQGRVTLEGTLGWRHQSDAAERAVRQLAGVTGLDNALRLTPAVAPDDVSARILRALQRDAELDASRIRVRVEGSRVILEGRVRYLGERQSAERAAWAVPGVTEVIDRLTIA
ncbi:BON domain-containing protein [Roseicyclus persicicus]|uniref:BON domain-containing protein n=1 Tax=Roseicyclus persicicus TaxID=2650661 RepID=A0A7X6GZW5_9RHOB|nr:BON domain-containing protein [Roseibacterium persicicum]NKX45437.1 BON domain-containing protein [Roseibacterium persicicum]